MDTREDDDRSDCTVCGMPADLCECPQPEPTAEQKQRAAESEAEDRALAHVYDAERAVTDAQDAKRFGAACKSMTGLLAANRLPSTFDDAKPWVRIWESLLSLSGFDVAAEAAKWIDTGATDPERVRDAVAMDLSPEELAARGGNLWD